MKTLKIILLIVLILGVVAITSILIATLFGGLSISFPYSVPAIVISDEQFEADGIETIEIDLASADVVLRKSENESFRVVFSGPNSEKEDPTITAVGESDKIVIQQRSQVMSIFGMGHRVVTVYIPESFSGTIDHQCASGDMEVTEDFSFDEFSYRVASGDMRCKNLVADKLTIDTSSGDLLCGAVEAVEFNLKTASGDMSIEKLIGNGSVKMISGDIRIDEYSAGGLISSSSGDISISLREMTSDLTIKAISGDIDMTVGQDFSAQLDISVTSGDISVGTPLDDAHVGKRTTTGMVGENPEYLLKIETTSGDVRFDG
ncbi:MAG: DUF4097 family beta strand repeat-containing protein [Oscillospiraceae bacterium]|nr:DUF4097 family beta strand repeat-containing protein [Oscillospiraceae bacterium]